MEDKLIIDLWRKGLTVQQVAKEYMNSFNKKLKNKENEQNTSAKTCWADNFQISNKHNEGVKGANEKW